MTLARSLILHHYTSTCKGETFSWGIASNQHLYWTLLFREERERKKVEWHHPQTTWWWVIYFSLQLYIHLRIFSSTDSSIISGLTHGPLISKTSVEWVPGIVKCEGRKWDMEMIGERKNHCKLKNFSIVSLLKFFFFCPWPLSLYL